MSEIQISRTGFLLKDGSKITLVRQWSVNASSDLTPHRTYAKPLSAQAFHENEKVSMEEVERLVREIGILNPEGFQLP